MTADLNAGPLPAARAPFGWRARLMLAATLVTNIGSGMQTLAVGKLLFDKTGSISSFAGIVLLQYMLTFMTTFLAGTAVDRANPRIVCASVDCLRGVVVCIVSACWMSRYPIAAVVAVTLAIQLCKPFQRSAVFTLEPRLVEASALSRYNGHAVTFMQAGQLLGMFLCGAVLKHADAATAIFMNGLSFVAAGVLVALIRLPAGEDSATAPPPKSAQGAPWRLWDDWLQSARLIWRERLLLWLVILSAADYAMVDFVNLSIVPIVDASFGGDPYWLSLLDGAFAAGAICAGLCVDRAVGRLGMGKSIAIGAAAQALLFLSLAPLRSSAAVLVGFFGLGVATTLSSVAVTTALQLRIPRQFQGKLSSARSLYVAVVAASLVPAVAHGMAHGIDTGLLLGGLFGVAFFVCATAVLRAVAREKSIGG